MERSESFLTGQSFPDRLRAMGFRKWYERQLLSGHAHLVLTLLAGLGFMGAMELLFTPGPADRATDVVVLVVCCFLGIWSMRRYLYLLQHAEWVAQQANCPSCGVYARFTLRSAHPTHRHAHVACKRCEHLWTIDY